MGKRFIVKRTSLSGGTEYLVRASEGGYRWDKVARKSVHKFGSKSTASKNARQFDGVVDHI
jgi:hypothetical protein